MKWRTFQRCWTSFHSIQEDPDFIATLRLAANPSVPAPEIENEKDLQVLVHANLRLNYPHVCPEDRFPKKPDGFPR